MSKHWSHGMYVLAWCDTRSNGRMRMSWNEDKAKLEEMARAMPEGSDPALYSGLGKRLPLSRAAVDGTHGPSKTRKKRGKKSPVTGPAA